MTCDSTYWICVHLLLNYLPTSVLTQIRHNKTSGLIRIQTVWHSDGIPERIFRKSMKNYPGGRVKLVLIRFCNFSLQKAARGACVNPEPLLLHTQSKKSCIHRAKMDNKLDMLLHWLAMHTVLTFCLLCNFACLFCRMIFKKPTFLKHSFRNTIRVLVWILIRKRWA